MSTDTHARQPAGTPVGGQFAVTAKTESAVALGADRPTALPLGADVKTHTHQFHGEVTVVHSGCPMGAAQIMCQEVPIRPEALEPGYPWYTVTMHGGRGAAYVPHYEVIDADTGTTALRELTEALAAKDRAQRAVVKATTHLIAAQLLEAEPKAAYLELNDELTEYGNRVRTGRVLDADENVLHEDVEDIEPADGQATGALYDEVADLVAAYDDCNQALSCGAVTDPTRRPDGRLRDYPQHRIDLKAAQALYPKGQLS